MDKPSGGEAPQDHEAPQGHEAKELADLRIEFEARLLAQEHRLLPILSNFWKYRRLQRDKELHADDPRPLDEECTCPTCQNDSRAYLHHVHKAQEIISSMLLTWHNLHYYQELMQGLRDAIHGNVLDDHVAAFHEKRAKGDIAPLT